MHHASIHGRASTAGLLLDHGAVVAAVGEIFRDERKIGGFTPLHFSCLSGHYAIVALLVERGANIHITDEVRWKKRSRKKELRQAK